MTYHCKEKIKLKRSTFERLKKLFDVNLDDIDEDGNLTPDMEALVDETDYREDTEACEFWWFFENDAAISFKILCGQISAYDDCILWSDAELTDLDGEELVKIGDESHEHIFEPNYSIGESIEFIYQGDSYICEFEIID